VLPLIDEILIVEVYCNVVRKTVTHFPCCWPGRRLRNHFSCLYRGALGLSNMSTSPAPPTHQSSRPSGEPDPPLTFVGTLILGAFALFVLGVYNSPSLLDNAGWLPHTRNVDLYMLPDWFEGETRVCDGIQAAKTSRTPRAIRSLYCPLSAPMTSPHNLSVKFWGRVSRSDVGTPEEVEGVKFQWSCTRSSDGFVCKAIN
jgi:hypothetical protein